MIIKFYDLEKNLNKKINFYLLYGSNTGLIDEIIKHTLAPNLSKNVIRYEESEIIGNLDIFNEEISNKSLFDDSKLILVNRVTDKILQIIEL